MADVAAETAMVPAALEVQTVAVRLSPPRGWPDCFSTPELQQYIEHELKGQRVRLTERPGPADEAKIHRLRLKTDDSLTVARRVQQEFGWPIIAGYALYESLNAFSGPHEDKYLRGYASMGGVGFLTLNSALLACLEDPTAGGVTLGAHAEDTIAYTCRAVGELHDTKKETSWLKLELPADGAYRSAYTSEVRYWNAKLNKDGSTGKWVDGCFRDHKALVLVESRSVTIPKVVAKKAEVSKVHALYAGAEDLWYLDSKHHGPKAVFRRTDEDEVREREEAKRRVAAELETAGGNLWHTHNKHAPPPPK